MQDAEGKLKRIIQADKDRPTMVSFVVLESLRWGGILVVCYVVVMFGVSLFQSASQYLATFFE